MKILFVQPTADKRGHYGIWTSKFCQALGKTEHEIVLVTNKIHTERYLDEPRSFRVVEAGNGAYSFEAFDAQRTTHPARYWYGYFRNTYRVVDEALGLCRREHFDAVFLTDVEYLTASLLLRKHRGVIPPVLWHVQAANFTFDTYAGSFAKKAYKVFQRGVFRRVLGHEVKGFAVLGEYHREMLRKQLRLPKSFPIEVVPDGGELAANAADKSEARKALGIDYEGPLFLFLGLLRKDKGIEGLIDAVRKLQNADFRVVIAGAPFDYSAAQVEAMVAGIEQIDLRLGYVPDEQMSLYYASADAVVFPYTRQYTGSSGPLIKGACTHGRPVIATDVSEMGRLVREHHIGLLAPPMDSAAMSSSLCEFMAMPEECRKDMALRATGLAAQNSWDNIAEQFWGLCSKVVNGHSSL